MRVSSPVALLLTPAVEEAGDCPLLLQAVHLCQLRALAHTVLPGLWLHPRARPLSHVASLSIVFLSGRA